MIFIKPLKLHDKNYRYMQLCNSYDFYSREKIVSPFCHRIIVSSAIFVSYENLYFCLNICKEMSVQSVRILQTNISRSVSVSTVKV